METKVRCLHASRNLFVLVEPENSSRGGTYDQQHKHPLQDAETSECQQDGIPEEYWTGHERVGEGQIQCDVLRGKDQCPRGRKRRRLIAKHTATMDRHSKKIPLPPGSSCSEKPRSLPPGLARVPPAHFGDRKSARRGCRGRRGTRGFLQREISTGVQFGRRHSAWGNVPLLSGVGEARHFLQGSRSSDLHRNCIESTCKPKPHEFLQPCSSDTLL